MRQIGVVILILTVALFCFNAQAVAGEVENMFVVGAVAGAVEAPYSFVKNVVTCSSVWDCINIFKQLGKGGLNGIDRVVGTTLYPGSYKRDFGTNSKLAQNKILSNAVGYAAGGYILKTLEILRFGKDAIFSIDQGHNAMLVFGTLVGTGVGAAEAVVDQDLYDKEVLQSKLDAISPIDPEHNTGLAVETLVGTGTTDLAEQIYDKE